jgi:hypothetical protein
MEVGFTVLHNFGRQRIAVMESATHSFDFCGNSSTSHAVYYYGRVAELIVTHHSCSHIEKELVAGAVSLNNRRIITHRTHDLALLAGCPQTAALDVSNYTIPHVGDNVVGFGLGSIANAWMGMVAAVEGAVNSSTFPRWLGQAPDITDKFLYSYRISGSSQQHEKQSGGAVANGCGYLGMAHMVRTPSYGNANFAVVISSLVIDDFLRSNYDILETAEMCNTKVVKLPIMPFMDCKIEQGPRPLPSQEVV